MFIGALKDLGTTILQSLPCEYFASQESNLLLFKKKEIVSFYQQYLQS